MVEIIGSKYCLACVRVYTKLDRANRAYKFYDAFAVGENERYQQLLKIAEEDGYTHHPIGFINGECIGDGVSILSRFETFYEES
ncbi:hypothetical protein VPHF86_0041 [Vibrio phage F86]